MQVIIDPFWGGVAEGMERAAQLLKHKADDEVVGTVQHSALLDHAAAIRAEIKHTPDREG